MSPPPEIVVIAGPNGAGKSTLARLLLPETMPFLNANTNSIFDDSDEATRRFYVAVREAMLDHKRAGNSVAIWRDGKVVIVPPEEIEVSDSGASVHQSGSEKRK